MDIGRPKAKPQGTRRAAAWLALSLAVAVARPALAQAPEPSASDKETARALMKSGEDKLGSGDAAGALADFEVADRIMAVPTTREAVCKAQVELGRLVEARDTCLSVRQLPVTALPEPPPLQQARERALALASAIEPRLASLRLSLEGLPPGASAEVLLDGAKLRPEVVGAPQRVNPGHHTVKVTAPGQSFEGDVELGPGETRELPVVLVGTPPAPEPAPVELVAKPPTIPAPPPPLAPEPASDHGVWPLAGVGLGVGGAALLAGAITGMLALGKGNDLRDRCPDGRCPRPDTESDLATANALADASTATLVIGGVFTALGIGGLAASIGGEPDDDSAVRAEALVGPTSLGWRVLF